MKPLVTTRLPKEMAFIPLLSLFIAKDRENFERGRKCSLSFAMKRDKSHTFWEPGQDPLLKLINL
jgi:hypothetical protein